MKHRRYWVGASAALALAVAVSAAAGAGASTATQTKAAATKVTLQLKWVTQAQFAGYYAAAAKGYYKQAGLDVKIKVGGPDITPEQVVAGGQAEFGAALVRAGMDPASNKGVTIVKQPFDMNLFMSRQIDSASAMTYNELAQVLETKNPKTGKLTKLSELNVIKMQNIGTGMLEDGIFTTEKWIKDKGHQATAKKFLAASFKGWVYCRDHAADCVKIVLQQGPTLLGGHQKWQMNEINALVWPNKLGIGIMDKAAYARTAKIAKQFGAIKKPAGNGAYRDDLAKAAVAQLKRQGVDVNGKKWKKAVVKVTEGGK